MEPHLRLGDDLDTLRDLVLLMGGEAERALERAVRALVERDSGEARGVLTDDDRIDRLEVSIDRLCVDVLAHRRPAARELRFVISAAKVTPLLERIADHACNIARAALDLNDEPHLATYLDLPRMAGHASEMLRAALDAFTAGDAESARRIIGRDDEVDRAYNRLFHGLINLMATDPSTAPRAARLLLVAKHLERVADYVTDVCELTVYMAEAEFIKHTR